MLDSLRRLFQRPSGPVASNWRQRGNEALGRGDLATAASCYQEGTSPAPGDPLAWLNLAFVQLETSQPEAARASLRQAESLLPLQAKEMVDLWALAGREAQERSAWNEAEQAYRRVVERQPRHELAWRELGQVCEMQGRLAEAEHAYRRAIAVRGDFELAARDLARMLLRQERAAEALPLIDRCLSQAIPDREAFLLQARATFLLGRMQEALLAADRALSMGRDLDGLTLRGLALTGLRRSEEAVACYDIALSLQPDAVMPLIDSARSLMRLGEVDEALARVERAHVLAPGRRDAAILRATLLAAQLRCREALDLLEREIARGDDDPELVYSASFVYLLAGDFERGWAAQEARWRVRIDGNLNRQPDFGAPEWQGEDLEGRAILLFAEQGLGDSIQFLRYVPQVAARAATVYLVVQELLWPLLGCLPANVKTIASGDLPEIDFACALMSLPTRFATRLETIPGQIPYLTAPTERLDAWRSRLGVSTRRRVGVVWSGNARHANDRNRSLTLAQVRQAAAIAGHEVEFFSLQKETRAADEAVMHEWEGLRHFGPQLRDFGDTAALVMLMDLVISVDTSVAHLTGALGRPLSLLLPYAPDWRWLVGRTDSPWYSTAKLYRQHVAGDWSAPLAQAMAEIAQRC